MTKMKKKLRIAQVAPLWFQVPPKKYGGIERVVAFLTDELVKRGHEVTLFAAPGSKTRGLLTSVYPRPLIEAGISWADPFWNLENLATAYRNGKLEKFDIIHSHLDVWTLFFQDLVDVPTVLTMHNALYEAKFDKDEDTRIRIFQKGRKSTNAVFISGAMRTTSSVKFPKSTVIYNGIDTENFKFNPRGGDHFVWASRIDKYKGIENAIAAAEKTGVKLLLAGRLDSTQKNYFKKEIKPRLSRKIQYVGELTGVELAKFFGSAKAFVYPIEWEEPFGLVVAEAMSCGTPVIAYERGSMPELIRHGKTGFLARTLTGVTDAMKKVDLIDRAYVRNHAVENFRKELMADRYEDLYYKLLK
jgi:glycosyltransferase involved in cell wall biosynthesis